MESTFITCPYCWVLGVATTKEAADKFSEQHENCLDFNYIYSVEVGKKKDGEFDYDNTSNIKRSFKRGR